jgi:hypothetical protein
VGVLEPTVDCVERYPLRVGAIVLLARKHHWNYLEELGEHLIQLNFGKPPAVLPVEWAGRDQPFEAALAWLALPRTERRRYLRWRGDLMAGGPAYQWANDLANMLGEMVGSAVERGEITLIGGRSPKADTLELRNGVILRAMRLVFRADEEVDDRDEPQQPVGPGEELESEAPKPPATGSIAPGPPRSRRASQDEVRNVFEELGEWFNMRNGSPFDWQFDKWGTVRAAQRLLAVRHLRSDPGAIETTAEEPRYANRRRKRGRPRGK